MWQFEKGLREAKLIFESSHHLFWQQYLCQLGAKLKQLTYRKVKEKRRGREVRQEKLFEKGGAPPKGVNRGLRLRIKGSTFN